MNRHVRRSLATTGTTTLLAAALLTAPGAQAAAATTCQGKDVTIDGTGQPVVTGTAGNDVIAASLGSTVSALAGDDTICVLPGTATGATTVDAGEGKDSVETSTLPAAAAVTTTLGAGDDTYAGGPGSDTVVSGAAGQPNGDTIDLALGDDVLQWHGIQAPGAKVDLGGGANTLVDGDGGVVSIDARSRKLERAGVTVLQWTGAATTFIVDSTATSAAFTGTNDAETFVLREARVGGTPTTLTVDMAGGDDTVTTRSAVLDGSSTTGGDGADLIQVAHNYGKLVLDLDKGELETGEPDVTPDQSVKGFENADAVTATMTVKGTHTANVLNLQGCDVRGVGRAGADTISGRVKLEAPPALTCAAVKLVARGGKDADKIRGTAGNDRLFGNRGEDLVDARSGDDVIFGGLDDDRLRGNLGNDKVRGGQGNDELAGNAGDDRVQGDKGLDRLLGQAGNDVLVGGLNWDRGHGGQGIDKCSMIERARKCER
ncbi:calcium-binding protein [Nocardioides piscis]|uniref:Calcium-binding protein n=1 Tax=Nocardioides piscis TaxID=2714938 RepID=A0A6G7YBH7_9ACTN|nr:calcium-binding protein [Nocardioides piscis]QIK74079.1 calcium-binding protein [Nocardioides piscis]